MRTWLWREIDAPGEHFLAIFSGGILVATLDVDDITSIDEASEDAQFIVDACNAAEALKEKYSPEEARLLTLRD